MFFNLQANSFDALDSETYHMTYPYCKNTRIRQTAYDVAGSNQANKHSRKTSIVLQKSSDSDALTFSIDSCMILQFPVSKKPSGYLNNLIH